MAMIKLLLLLQIILLIPGTAFGISLDLSGIWSSEPYEPKGAQVGSTFGFGAGGSINLTENIQGRLDASYFKYKDVLTYYRVPVFLGARYILSVKPISFFTELGFEMNFDKEEEGKGYVRENNHGIAPGAGLLFPIAGAVSAGIGARYHHVDDPYYTVALSLGIKL